jgi:predicted acyltransferase (DUF342 family)
MRQSSRYLLHLFVLLMLSALAYAKANPDRTQINHDIRIGPEEKAGDTTCINCNVYVRGQILGDVTTIHGDILVDEDAAVTGDVTTVLGDARVQKGANISGDLTVVGGVLRRQPGATISGDSVNFENRFLVVLMLLSPLMVLALIIALIVWLVRRGRRPQPVAASPGSYR